MLINHLIDTIFIIRRTQDFSKSESIKKSIKNYMKNLDIIRTLNNTDNLLSELADNSNFDKKITIDTEDNSEFNGVYGKDNENLFRLANSVLPSRKIIYIFLNNESNNNIKDYYLNKFTESYLLGLSFVGCFPVLKASSPWNIGVPLKNINFTITVTGNNFTAINKEIIPFLGFIKLTAINDIMRIETPKQSVLFL